MGSVDAEIHAYMQRAEHALKVAESNFKDDYGVFVFHGLLPNKNVIGFLEHIHIHLGHRTKTSSQGENILFVENGGGEEVVAIRTKHHRIGHVVANQL